MSVVSLPPIVSAARSVAAVVHALAGAAWLGSMFYSLLIVQPRAKAFFADDSRFEEFVATLAQGARWKVLSAFSIVLVSGLALIPVSATRPLRGWWLALIVTKIVLFAAALGVFCYASWHLWPSRIFAAPDEVPRIQRRFRRVGIAILILIGLAFALGVVAHLPAE
jgi:uncharacterized membrane protein